MKIIVTLLVISFAILACGGDETGLQNSPPVIDHVVAPEPVEPGATVELQVVAHDADGDALSYVWEAKEGKLDSSLGRVVKWTAPTDAKSAVVVVHANDGVNESTVKSKKIAVNLQNSAPVIKRILVPDKVHAGARIQLEAITEDADEDTLTLNWEVEAGILSTETTPETVWTAPFDANSTSITLAVDDGINEVVEKSANVRVIHSLIVPGKEAAGIELGDKFDRVRALYGKPDKLDAGLFFYWDIGLSGSLDGSRLVTIVSIFKPIILEEGIKRPIRHKPNTAKTAGGIGVKSALKRVEGEFGPAEEVKDGGLEHWYWSKGIQFDYDDNLKVKYIFIFRPVNRLDAAPEGFDFEIQLNRALMKKAASDKYYVDE